MPWSLLHVPVRILKAHRDFSECSRNGRLGINCATKSLQSWGDEEHLMRSRGCGCHVCMYDESWCGCSICWRAGFGCHNCMMSHGVVGSFVWRAGFGCHICMMSYGVVGSFVWRVGYRCHNCMMSHGVVAPFVWLAGFGCHNCMMSHGVLAHLFDESGMGVIFVWWIMVWLAHLFDEPGLGVIFVWWVMVWLAHFFDESRMGAMLVWGVGCSVGAKNRVRVLFVYQLGLYRIINLPDSGYQPVDPDIRYSPNISSQKEYAFVINSRDLNRSNSRDRKEMLMEYRE